LRSAPASISNLTTFDIPALAATISAVSPWLFLEFVLQGITDNAIKAAIRRKNQWRVTVCGWDGQD
jgi:hypothetical protein